MYVLKVDWPNKEPGFVLVKDKKELYETYKRLIYTANLDYEDIEVFNKISYEEEFRELYNKEINNNFVLTKECAALYRKYRDEFSINIKVDVNGFYYIADGRFEIKEGSFLTFPCFRSSGINTLLKGFEKTIEEARKNGTIRKW